MMISLKLWIIRQMSTERTLYKYLVWPMGFSLRQANLFMCKANAISRGRRAAGYWNSIPGPEVRLASQKLSARLTKIPVHRGVAPYAIILLLIFSPLQREPHGPNISNLAIALLLNVLINRMIQNYSDASLHQIKKGLN
jgi:hypothetical protein